MKYSEKRKAINYLKRCSKKTINFKFSYKNVHLLIQMIFKVKDFMEAYDGNRATNKGLNQVIQTHNKEMMELIKAKKPTEIQEKFKYACRRFNEDLDYCFCTLGVETITLN